MHYQHHFLEAIKSQLHYSKYGNGNKILLCFHGYGQSRLNFHELEGLLKEEYTIYSFDLFFHGKSLWYDKDYPVSKKYWCALMEVFFKEHAITRFSLMGFSMGAKFVLSILECYPERIDKITLIAPDGIQTSFWYNLAAYPSWTRGLFRRIILRPGFYFKLVKALRFFRIVDEGILRFSTNQMATKQQRRRVYYTWIVFKELRFDIKKLATLLVKFDIRIEMFLGIHDKIITAGSMNKLLKRINNYEMNVLESGHSGLMKAVADYFRKKK